MTIGEAVKERILQLCAERDPTINKLSTISGVTQSTVNNVVGGRNNSTTVSTLQKLCDGLGITIIDFFNDDLFKDIEPEVKASALFGAARKATGSPPEIANLRP